MKETSDASGVSLTPPAAAALSAAAVTAMVAKKAQPASAPHTTRKHPASIAPHVPAASALDNRISAPATGFPRVAAASHATAKQGTKLQRRATSRTSAPCASVFGGSLASVAPHTTAKEDAQKIAVSRISASAVPAPSISAPSLRASSALAQSAPILQQAPTLPPPQRLFQQYFHLRGAATSLHCTIQKNFAANHLRSSLDKLSSFFFSISPQSAFRVFAFCFLQGIVFAQCAISAFALPGDNPNLRILSFTKLNSANWIWSEEKTFKEYYEFDGKRHDGKKRFPQDFARTTIGIGEKFSLKLKGKAAAIGDIKKARWSILEGSKDVEIIGSKVGEQINLGAKVVVGNPTRTVKIRVTTERQKTATIELKIVQPDGKLKSRHAGKPPKGADVPDTSGIEFLDEYTPESQREYVKDKSKLMVPAKGIGAWSILVVIVMPGTANFGGDFEKGIEQAERDISSPPKQGTFSPEKSKLFKDFKHETVRIFGKINSAWSGFSDAIYYSNEGYENFKKVIHTCTWTCGEMWKCVKIGKIVPFDQVIQKFTVSSTGKGPGYFTTTVISKFNSSVRRAFNILVSFPPNVRDTENDWKP